MYWFLDQEAFHLIQTRIVLYNIPWSINSESEDVSWVSFFLSLLKDNSWNVHFSKQPNPDSYNWGMLSTFEILTKTFVVFIAYPSWQIMLDQCTSSIRDLYLICLL